MTDRDWVGAVTSHPDGSATWHGPVPASTAPIRHQEAPAMTTKTRPRKRRSSAALYDAQHRYIGTSPRDPEPEPCRKAVVAGARGVPAAPSWIANAQPVHHQLVRAHLRELQGGRVTRVNGWGDQSAVWAVCHDHGGFWEIPCAVDIATRDLAAARGKRGLLPDGIARRLLRVVLALAVLALVTWTSTTLLSAMHAPTEIRVYVGLGLAAVVVVAGLVTGRRQAGGQR